MGNNILKGIRGGHLFCALGHELVRQFDKVKDKNKELRLEDCATSLFSEEKDGCLECGVCAAYLDIQGKTTKEALETAAILYAQRKVLHPKVVQQSIHVD